PVLSRSATIISFRALPFLPTRRRGAGELVLNVPCSQFVVARFSGSTNPLTPVRTAHACAATGSSPHVSTRSSSRHETEFRVHTHRTSRCDRHHRHFDRPATSRGAEGPRGGRTHQMHEQPQATWPRAAQLRRREPQLPARPGGVPAR